MSEHDNDSPMERKPDPQVSGPDPDPGHAGSPADAGFGAGARAPGSSSEADSGADDADTASHQPAGGDPARAGGTTRIPSGPAGDDWWFDKDQGPGPDDESRGPTRRPRWRAMVAAGAIGVAALAGIGAVRAGSDGDGTTAISDRGPGGQMPGDGQGAPDGAFPGGYGGFPGGAPGDDGNHDGGDGGPGGMGRPGVFGTVTSVDDSSFEVETPEGDTVAVTVDDDTELTQVADDQPDDAELSDLEEGDDVMVMGETSDDGDVTADRVVFGDDLADGGRMGVPPPDGNGRTGNLPGRGDDENDGSTGDRHSGSGDSES
jgi:hypothetical protein